MVKAIVEAHNGLLWVGTGWAVASFDGLDFTPINLQTEEAPPPGGVHALLKSSSEDLRVGTDAEGVRIAKVALDQFLDGLRLVAGGKRYNICFAVTILQVASQPNFDLSIRANCFHE